MSTQTAPRKRQKRNWWEPGKGKWQARWWTPDRYWRLLEGIERGRSDEAIARRLGTTAVAVRLARKRAGISTNVPGVLTSRDAAKLLGIPCAKTIVGWIKQGWLRGRHGRPRGQYRRWHITFEALQTFLANPDHWHRWDADRITDENLRAWALRLPKPRYLTTGEVAERLFVEHPTVNQWIHRGVLSAVRNGNWLIPETELENFVPPGQRERGGYRIQFWTEDEVETLQTMRAAGHTLAEIATALNRTLGSVANRNERLRQGQEVAA